MACPKALRFFKAHGLDAFPIGPQETSLVQTIKSGRYHLVETYRENPQIGEIALQEGFPFIWKPVVDPMLFKLSRSWPLFTQMQQLAHRVVVLSKRFIDSFPTQAQKRLRVIPEGIHCSPFTASACQNKRRTFRRWLGLAPSTVAIGMAANFTYRKRQIDFVQAARWVIARHPHVKFLMFGGTFKERQGGSTKLYRLLIEQFIREFKLKKHIETHSFYPDRVALAAGLDLVVLPSVGEGHPLTLLEAMAAGKPVIGADSGGTPDLIEHGRNGYLIPPDNPRRLAKAILDLMTHPKRRQRFGRSGKQKLHREFNIQLRAPAHEELYAEFLR
jgi:glycosyltransferase involved in cell wall biosynthesis